MLRRNAQICFAEPTGLMFHHFHGGIHPEVQGSITGSQFRAILEAVGIHNVLSADIWMQKAIDGKLRPADTCVTFDDALLCQYDVAKPVLDELGVRAFWFIYTSVFEGTVEKLELFRYFRSTAFGDMDEFYHAFFNEVEGRLGARYSDLWNRFDPTAYLPHSPFYTPSDRWFRFLRDQVLGQQTYFSIIESMIDAANFDRNQAAMNLWLRAEQVRELADDGHVIGLHSHTHPTTMGKLPRDEQLREYSSNAEHIHALTGKPARAVSHPCNSYNHSTLDLLSDLEIKIGFRADIAPVSGRGPLEYCREDHANLLRQIQEH